MILVISRFKVANAMESQVRAAFCNRPRLVEHAAGYLGMEVFTDAEDPSLFYLVTRWTDEGSYKAWHGSKAHRLSHAGIPAGLKIEHGSTEIKRMERVAASNEAAQFEERVADASPMFARFLANSQSTHLLIADMDGQIRFCNRTFLGRLKLSEEQVFGRPLWEVMPQEDAVTLRAHVEMQQRGDTQSFLFNFVGADDCPFTLNCHLDVQPAYFILVGELPLRKNEQSTDELMRLNNELAVLGRENARKSKELNKAHAELQKALTELQTSHWHLKKLQEVLPICMECGRVKTGGEWGDVIMYLKKNALFLSHGYCPDCYERVRVQMGLSHKE